MVEVKKVLSKIGGYIKYGDIWAQPKEKKGSTIGCFCSIVYPIFFLIIFILLMVFTYHPKLGLKKLN
jgi:hypothetical protein